MNDKVWSVKSVKLKKELVAYAVVPVNDIVEHEVDRCPCNPDIFHGHLNIEVHHAKDGREK